MFVVQDEQLTMSDIENSAGDKGWKSVARPIPNRDVPEVMMNGPPVIAPKPRRPEIAPKPDIVTKPDGSKVWAYMYSVPEPTVATYNNNKINYPRSGECVPNTKPKPKRFRRYVPPDQISSRNSRGGRMFQKQKKRMNEYVLTAPVDYQSSPGYQSDNAPVESRRAPQPREYSRHTPAGSKNMPALINNTMNAKSKSKMSGPVFRPLRSPPPEWRAKVDAGYSRSNYTPQYVSKRWVEENYGGYESAPPEDLNYEDAEFMNSFVAENGVGSYARSLHGSRAESREGPETAAFYFNAKYHNKPHYLAKPQIRRDAFVTTPYSNNDFNARAVGWSRAYAQQY